MISKLVSARWTCPLVLLSSVLAGVFALTAVAGAQSGAAAGKVTAKNAPDFGPNVTIIDQSMTSAQITTTLTALSNEAQFSTNRYAVLFKPGAYSVQAPVGYYEQIAGLGETPGTVTITGFLTPNFGTPVYGTPTWPQANLTDIFWRSMENMAFNVVTDTTQNAPANTLQWGVSQGSPLRRLQINGGLELVNSYCGFASGGFIADLVVSGNVNTCSQQQWYSRNSSFGSWSGAVWNMVFSGVQGAPAQSYPTPPYTTLATTPASREKPFLYVDEKGNYNVFAPAVQRNSTGTTWYTGTTPGRSLSIKKFLIAQPSTPVQEINEALSSGMNLILTPGIYPLNAAIRVTRPDTIVLGMGYATLVPQTGDAAITVADVDGVEIAGLIIDAGPITSPVLLRIGNEEAGESGDNHRNNPVSVSDVFFRIGGATAGSALNSLVVNSNDTILDDIWAWRADHGTGVGWTQNIADHGLVVNGNNVTATGLAVEHYQKSQVQWNGNGGETIFYQSELPYDPPSQSAWMDGSANGYPSYVVAKDVSTHQAYGLGIYSFFDLGVYITDDNAMTVPDTKGVSVHDAGTVFLSTSGTGQITHVVNNTGNISNASDADQLQPVVTYP